MGTRPEDDPLVPLLVELATGTRNRGSLDEALQ